MVQGIEARVQRPPVMRWSWTANAWEWIDEERRRKEPPPNIQQIVSAAIKGTTLAKAAEAIGFSRQTTAALGGGFNTIAAVYVAAGVRLVNIARTCGEELGEP